MECPFNDPCSRCRGLLSDIDELQREIERLRAKSRIGETVMMTCRNEKCPLGGTPLEVVVKQS